MKITKSPVHLYASEKGVITLFLQLHGSHRITNIVKRVEDLKDEEVNGCLEKVMTDFSGRHRHIEQTFLNHTRIIEDQYGALSHFSPQKKLLLGAIFTKEYSIEAAALFNPSIVPHPDQQNLKPGEVRFVMSLRATGEGHISSIVFHTGLIDDNGNITLDSVSGYFTRLQKKGDTEYSKEFIRKCAASNPEFNMGIMDILPDSFSAAKADQVFKSPESHSSSMIDSIIFIEKVMDTNYELIASPDMPINEQVIFPNAKAERMGMEDVRFVKFDEGGQSCYYATYTAYDGNHIKTQLIETKDFKLFKIRSLFGEAISDKGMALFPEKLNGQYVMISRQGGETINIMYSDDLYRWENFRVLLEPRFEWELVQAGNCGSPIKTEKGWLLLTHGVGPMRTYVISAILLDLHDPSLVIGRLHEPLIEADENEREGYVPNVVYTCGFMLHKDMLIIPYAVSDSATAFATIGLNEILNEMKP
ncbi:MAG TPA: glycoside hydrolase family 130 protein [Chitinophagales bacterium]|nr:glycoside hydrolase family 130 protein [Chitinophagales bacterium]